MSHLKRTTRFFAIALVAGCTTDAGGPFDPAGAGLAISDGAHGGAVAGFYFLPPIVEQPVFAGSFDAGLSPTVHVCVLVGAACDATVATFSGSSVQMGSDHYRASWNTDRSLNPVPHYRIVVRVGTFVLGWADVDVLSSGSERNEVDENQFVAVVAGQTLQIRFRIETGIAAAIAVTPSAATVDTGQTQQFSAEVFDLHGNPLPAAVVSWESDDTGVAVVSGTGLARGVAPGTATITASSEAASGSATLEVSLPNTAPTAAADTFQAIGNVTVPVPAPGVLANDTDAEGNTLSVVPGTVATASGGTAVLAADGSFTYLSAAGYVGVDSFQYTLSDGALTATASAVMNVPTRVWYAGNDAPAPGDGRDSSPFTRLADAEAASAAGETVLVLRGDGTTAGYADGFTFKPGQSLTGQGISANLTALLNGTPVLLLAAGSAPQLTRSSGGPTISLATNNTLQGVDVASTAGAGVLGSGFGTLAAAQVNVAAVGGPALNLEAGTVAGDFGALSSAGSAGHGLRLTAVNGTLNAAGGAITGAAATGIRIIGGNAAIDLGGGISGSGTRAVVVSGRTGGSVTLTGTITDAAGGILVKDNTGGSIAFDGPAKSLATGTGAAVTLEDNAGATIAFGGGGLEITTGAGAGFSATGGGSVTVTGAGNRVVSAGGVAVRIEDTTIGSAGITFRSVSATGGANGIVLANTGAVNGFQVTGDGVTAGSGGTVSGMTGADGSTAGIGVRLASTRNVSLAYMQLNDFANFAVQGTSVAGFALLNSIVSGTNGSSAVQNEGSIVFAGLTGSAAVTGTSISGGVTDNFRVVNGSGTLDRITFSSTTIGGNSLFGGDDGVELVAQGNAVIRATVQASTFTSARGNLLQVTLLDAASADLVVSGSAFSNDHAAVVGGGGGVVVDGSGTAGLTYSVSNNTFRDARGSALAISQSAGASTFRGTVSGNRIGLAAAANSGSEQGSGISLTGVGGSIHSVTVTDNEVRQYNNYGILLQLGDASFGGTGSLDATVTGNTVSGPGTAPTNKNGIHLNAGTTSIDSHDVCLALTGNTLAGSGSGGLAGTDVRLRQRFLTTVSLPGYMGGSGDNAAVQAFVQTGNGLTTTVLAQNATLTGGGGYVGGTGCDTP